MLRSAIIVLFLSVFALACGLYVGEDSDGLDKKLKKPCADTDAGPGGPIPDAGTWPDGGWGTPDAGGWYPDAGYDPYPDAGS